MTLGPPREKCDFCGEDKGSLICRAKHRDPPGLRDRHEQYVRSLEDQLERARLAGADLMKRAAVAEAQRDAAFALIRDYGNAEICWLEYETRARELGIEVSKNDRPFATKKALHEQVARLQEELRLLKEGRDT